MPGETDLDSMLQGMTPQLIPGEFVFCSFTDARYGDHRALAPVASIAEPEGLTLVIPRSRAEQHSLEYSGVFRCISLMIHSSLAGVGLTAAVSTQLANVDISANMIAGYYHDHVFVPATDAERALQALLALAANHQP